MTQDRRGAVAVEFAFVAPILILLAIWMFEFAFMMIRQQAVDYAANAAARVLRTGVAQKSASPEDLVRQVACDAGFGWLECARLDIDVRTWPSFADVSPATPQFDPQTGRASNFDFDPGGPTAIMTVRIAHPHESATALIGPAFNLPPNLVSAQVIRAEPWL